MVFGPAWARFSGDGNTTQDRPRFGDVYAPMLRRIVNSGDGPLVFLTTSSCPGVEGMSI